MAFYGFMRIPPTRSCTTPGFLVRAAWWQPPVATLVAWACAQLVPDGRTTAPSGAFLDRGVGLNHLPLPDTVPLFPPSRVLTWFYATGPRL